MRNASRPHRSQGFTLIEVLVTIVVVGLLAVAGTSMISSTFSTARIVESGQATSNDARYAVERLAREIREVKYTGTNTGYAISSTLAAGSTGMTFTKVDSSGADVTVTIASSGGNLTLGTSSPSVTSNLSSQVSSFSLDFLKLDSGGTATASATTLVTNVRFVVITLTVADATSGQTVTERVRVALRNV